MSAVKTRMFELMSTVTFHNLEVEQLEGFAAKLNEAIRATLADYPSVAAFLIEPDMRSGEVNFGLRFSAVDPAYMEDMASEILDKAVSQIAATEGMRNRVEAEREESVLVLAR